MFGSFFRALSLWLSISSPFFITFLLNIFFSIPTFFHSHRNGRSCIKLGNNNHKTSMIITWSIVRSEEKNYHRMIKLFLFFSRVRVNLRCCTFVFHFVRFARNYFVFFKIRIKGKRNGSLIPDVKEKRQRRRFDSKHQYKFQKWFTINWSQFTKSWSIYTSVHCVCLWGCLSLAVLFACVLNHLLKQKLRWK